MDILIKAMAKDEPLLIVSLDDTETVEEARRIHDTYPTASAALGRTISGAILMSSLLKEGQKIIIQISGDGPLKEIVAEADWLSRVRAYVKRPHIHLGLKDDKLDVGRAIGNGILTVIKDLGLREYYRGSVPLQTGEIATDLAYYLRNSEQIPAAVSLGVYVETDNSVRASGGFMIHALPDVTEKAIIYLEERLKKLQPVSSMILKGMTPEEIIEEALGMPFDIMERRTVSYYCPCTKERVIDAIVSLGKEDIREFIRKGEPLEIQCQFCKKAYTVTQDELEELLKSFG
ncbi:MAG: Hsp33 family molecular chaperone HslO [Thermodesulfovibrionales bacterium]